MSGIQAVTVYTLPGRNTSKYKSLDNALKAAAEYIAHNVFLMEIDGKYLKGCDVPFPKDDDYDKKFDSLVARALRRLKRLYSV